LKANDKIICFFQSLHALHGKSVNNTVPSHQSAERFQTTQPLTQ
jgi:hypothetical protein